MLERCTPWPSDLADRYRAQGFWRGETLGDLLRAAASRSPAATALVDGSRRLSYAELDRLVDRTASGLLRSGLQPGDRVVVQLPNSIELVQVCGALFRAGIVAVLALPAHRRSEIAHLCEASGARGYVTVTHHAGFDHLALGRELLDRSPRMTHLVVAGFPGPDADGRIRSLDGLVGDDGPLPDIDPAEVAFFLLSGGTTGRPKLIPRTHDDYVYNVRRAVEVSAMDERSVQLICLPMTHNGALGCPGFLGSIATGGTAVLSTDPSPNAAFRLIAAERVTLTTLVPPLAAMWLDAAAARGPDLSSLTLLQIGGAKLANELARRVGPTLGCRLQQWFGLGEGFLACTRLDDDPDHIVTTQGRPLSRGDEVRVVDRDGRPVPERQVGELLVRGPTTFCGYYDAAAHNREVFTDDGFFRTGDLVRRLPSGHLVVSGRVKDVIIRGGEKIAAEEVENELLAHPDVADVAIVGVPDQLVGERVCAFVRTKDGTITLRELAGFLRTRGIAAYKIPERLELVTEFPLTAVGKVSKKELRDRLAVTTGGG